MFRRLLSVIGLITLIFRLIPLLFTLFKGYIIIHILFLIFVVPGMTAAVVSAHMLSPLHRIILTLLLFGAFIYWAKGKSQKKSREKKLYSERHPGRSEMKDLWESS